MKTLDGMRDRFGSFDQYGSIGGPDPEGCSFWWESFVLEGRVCDDSEYSIGDLGLDKLCLDEDLVR